MQCAGAQRTLHHLLITGWQGRDVHLLPLLIIRKQQDDEDAAELGEGLSTLACRQTVGWDDGCRCGQWHAY